MATIADPLLAGADAADSKISASGAAPRCGRLGVVAGAGLTLAGLGLLCAALGPGRSLRSSPETAAAALLEGWGDASCYTFTGGTCMVMQCNADRGAVCSGRHNCYCAQGCAGADGLCRNNITRYQQVGKNVRFRNMKWGDQYLYAPRTWFMEQLRVTSSKGEYADTWNVYKMPGRDYVWGRDMYLLSPTEFPEYAAGVASTKMSAYVPGGKGDQTSGYIIPVGSLFVVDLYHLTHRHLLAEGDPFNIAQVMNHLCRPPNHPEAVQIDGALGQASWYVHHASWEVFGWVWSDPGQGGYWVPDPPLNIDLPVCRE